MSRRPRGFIIPRGLEAASLSRRISIERFAGPPGGGRDECRRMCRPQGRGNLIHCPPFPVSFSPSSCLSFPPACRALPPLVFSLSLPCSLSLSLSLARSPSVSNLPLCVSLSPFFPSRETPLFLCAWLYAAVAVRFQLIARNRRVSENAVKAEPKEKEDFVVFATVALRDNYILRGLLHFSYLDCQ